MLRIQYAVVGATLALAPIIDVRAFAESPVAISRPSPPSPDETKTLMAPYRARIDTLDAQIVTLLGQRFDVIHEVAVFKARHGIHSIQPERIEEVVQHARAQAEKSGVDPNLIEKLYRIVIQTACEEEEKYARAQGAGDK